MENAKSRVKMKKSPYGLKNKAKRLPLSRWKGIAGNCKLQVKISDFVLQTTCQQIKLREKAGHERFVRFRSPK